MKLLSRILGRTSVVAWGDPDPKGGLAGSSEDRSGGARIALASGDLASAYGWACDAVSATPASASALRVGAGALMAWGRHAEALDGIGNSLG